MKLIIKLLLFTVASFTSYNVSAITEWSVPTSKTAMAVSAQHYATTVGIDVLKKGGNAVDAAVAMGYALAVVHPCCGNLGGGGFMLIHFANNKNTFINFREKAPANIKPQLFFDSQNNVMSEKLTKGYLAAGIPGSVLGLNTALKKYGTLSLKELIQPAIELAENGFILSEGDINYLNPLTARFKSESNVAEIFLNNGRPYKTGERLIQKNLANTLKIIANEGSDAFYNGKIADEIVLASQNNGGVFTKQDFKNYSVIEKQPITCTYRGYQIITTPLPGSGTTLCEILNISEGYALKQHGFHSAMATHYVIEAMRYAYADRNSYLGDTNVRSPKIKHLVSKSYSHQIRNKIMPNKAGDSYNIGFIANPGEKANTTSYVVVDKNGNAVSVTYTLNDNFGAKVIAGNTGFFLNNEIDDFAIKVDTPNMFKLFQNSTNLAAPNKRPLSSMSPTIILKDNKLFMVIGTPGGSTIPTQLIQSIQNVIDFDMSMQAAIDAPRFHMQWLPDLVYIEPDALSNNVLEELTAMGYKFKLGSPYNTKRWGRVTAILKNPQTNLLDGAIDIRAPAGSAVGY